MNVNQVKIRRVLLLSLLLVIPAIIVVSAVRSHRAQLKFELENSPEAFERHNVEVLGQWRTNSYVPLTESETIRSKLTELVRSQAGSHPLTAAQEIGLIDEFSSFFGAYSMGTWEAFSAFRFPPNVGWHWRTNIVYNEKRPPYSAEHYLDEYYKYGPSFGSDAMQTNFANHYGVDHKAHKLTRAAPVGMDAKYREFVYQCSDCSFYSNFVTAVNLDHCRVLLVRSNSIPASLTATPFYPPPPDKGATMPIPMPNLGYFASFKEGLSLVEFDHSIEDTVKDGGEILYCDSFFFLQTDGKDGPFPVALRFYWSPADSRWLPAELVVGTLQTLILRWPIF